MASVVDKIIKRTIWEGKIGTYWSQNSQSQIFNLRSQKTVWRPTFLGLAEIHSALCASALSAGDTEALKTSRDDKGRERQAERKQLVWRSWWYMKEWTYCQRDTLSNSFISPPSPTPLPWSNDHTSQAACWREKVLFCVIFYLRECISVSDTVKWSFNPGGFAWSTFWQLKKRNERSWVQPWPSF